MKTLHIKKALSALLVMLMLTFACPSPPSQLRAPMIPTPLLPPPPRWPKSRPKA